MSYILDALKKSEEERNKLQKRQRSPYASIKGRYIPPRRRKIIPAIIISTSLLLVVSILGYGWWFGVRPSDKTVSNPILPASQKSPATVAETSPSPEQQVEAAQESKGSGPLEEPGPDPPVARAPAEKVAQRKPAGGSEGIPLLSELPFATQAMLPELQFRGHVFSPSPSERMIMINSTVIREGEFVAPDLILQEITETGLIIKFRDTLFKVELF